MDPQNPAKRKRPARARQRLTANSSSARRRHTQQPSRGGVSGGKRDDERAEQQSQPSADGETSPEATENPGLRDRLQSSALAVTERVRRASQRNPFIRMGKDPLARQTTWIVEPTWYERIHNWLADAMPFGWRERARRYGFWRRRALPIIAVFACLAVGLSVGIFALKTAGRVAGAFSIGPDTTQSTPGGSVMISPLNATDTTPTPTLPQYDVGVWVSDTLPQGGSVTVFVRVSNNTLPQPNARVYVHADTPNGGINIGPLTTNSYGVASTKLNYGNVGQQQPIYLTATTSIGGQNYSGVYTFVTFGGQAAPQATPGG